MTLSSHVHCVISTILLVLNAQPTGTVVLRLVKLDLKKERRKGKKGRKKE